jgi:hypothetical protein
MTPTGVPRTEPLVQIGGLGVHLRLSDRRMTTLPSRANQPPGRSILCARRQPIDGSTQCQDDAATRTSKRRSRSSQSSNAEVSTSALPKAASRRRANAAIPAPGSRAVTEHPSAASARVAWPVPQPTSSTDDLLSMRAMVTVREQPVRVSRPDPVVERRHLLEHPTKVTPIRVCHRTILPRCARDPAPLRSVQRSAHRSRGWPAVTSPVTDVCQTGPGSPAVATRATRLGRCRWAGVCVGLRWFCAGRRCSTRWSVG